MIGIIGGAGVAATNKLLEIIEENLTENGAYRDCHHPEMIIWQATQAPSRSMFLEGKGETFIPEYTDIAKRLKHCGVDKLCMCCNTAHWAIDEISTNSGLPFINLVEQVVLKTAKLGVKSVGLVASDGCLKGKVYERYFEKHCSHIKIIYPNSHIQKLITKGICNVKNINRFKNLENEDNPANIFKRVKEHLIENGAEKVIMGCTDIRVAYEDSENIDSLSLLAELIISERNI